MDCGPDWTWDVIKVAVARGPHPTTRTPEAIALFEEDIEYQRRAGFCKIILLGNRPRAVAFSSTP